MNHPPLPFNRCRTKGFTLIELLTVVAIIGILAALVLPVTGNMQSGARTSQSLNNLKQIGTAFQLYAADNDGVIPAVSSGENKVGEGWMDSDPWWNQCLTPYLGGKSTPRRWEAPDVPFSDPVYRALVGKAASPGWRGGYSMNSRVNLVRGETFSEWNTESSRSKRYKLANIRGDSVLVTMGYWEGFAPSNDGLVAPQRFSSSNSSLVPHDRRIGANKAGVGGKSALYLFADGSVKNLNPTEAAEFLKLKN